MPGKGFVTRRFHWATTKIEFWDAQRALFDTIESDGGVYSSDAMIVWGRNLGFLDDAAFVAAWEKHAKEPHERGILWRTAVLVWAARMGARREGDFAEFGCYAGTSARIIADVVPPRGRRFFLYDLFETPEGVHSMPEHGADLYRKVVRRFPEPTVKVIRGLIPESFSKGLPEQIAFAHIDLNNAQAEIATLDVIESRLVTGAVIVLDDFGQTPYEEQHLAHLEWFGKRGIPILEIPTGQGVVIW